MQACIAITQPQWSHLIDANLRHRYVKWVSRHQGMVSLEDQGSGQSYHVWNAAATLNNQLRTADKGLASS
jgi:hypothetical protein